MEEQLSLLVEEILSRLEVSYLVRPTGFSFQLGKSAELVEGRAGLRRAAAEFTGTDVAARLDDIVDSKAILSLIPIGDPKPLSFEPGWSLKPESNSIRIRLELREKLDQRLNDLATSDGYERNLPGRLQRLSDWLQTMGIPPTCCERFLLTEIHQLDGYTRREPTFLESIGLISREKPPSVPRNILFTPEQFAPRFEELVRIGYEWIHLTALGVIEGQMVVSVNHSRRDGFPPQLVQTNMAGPNPPWKLKWKLI